MGWSSLSCSVFPIVSARGSGSPRFLLMGLEWNYTEKSVCKDTHGLIVEWFGYTGKQVWGHFSSHFSQDRWEVILIFMADKSVYGTLCWGVEDPASHPSKPVSKSAWMSGRKNTHWAVISNPTESQAGTAKPNTTHWKKIGENPMPILFPQIPQNGFLLK